MTVSSRKPRSLTLIDPFLEQGLPLVGTPKKREREKKRVRKGWERGVRIKRETEKKKKKVKFSSSGGSWQRKGTGTVKTCFTGPALAVSLCVRAQSSTAACGDPDALCLLFDGHH